MRQSKEGKAAVDLWYVFARPIEDHRLKSPPQEVEDSIANANGQNVSGSGPINERDVTWEGSLDVAQVARAILVRDIQLA